MVIAAIQEEEQWRRVKNLVVFLHTGRPNLLFICMIEMKPFYAILLGGLSSADWSVRRLGGGGSMPTTGDSLAACIPPPSTGVTRRTKQSKVLENRDLCRIVASFLPKDPSIDYVEEEEEEEEDIDDDDNDGDDDDNNGDVDCYADKEEWGKKKEDEEEEEEEEDQES